MAPALAVGFDLYDTLKIGGVGGEGAWDGGGNTELFLCRVLNFLCIHVIGCIFGVFFCFLVNESSAFCVVRLTCEKVVPGGQLTRHSTII